VAKGHTYFWPKPGRRDEERKKFSALMRKVEATRLRYGIPGISCLTFGKLSRALAFMLSLRDVSESVGARDCDEVGNFFETSARKLGRTKRCARSFSRTTYDGCSFNRRFDELWGGIHSEVGGFSGSILLQPEARRIQANNKPAQCTPVVGRHPLRCERIRSGWEIRR